MNMIDVDIEEVLKWHVNAWSLVKKQALVTRALML